MYRWRIGWCVVPDASVFYPRNNLETVPKIRIFEKKEFIAGSLIGNLFWGESRKIRKSFRNVRNFWKFARLRIFGYL